MNNNDDPHPDLLPDKDHSIQMVPSLKQQAPPLRHGSKFDGWADAAKVVYLDKLAASLNQALDLMQQDRNRLSKIAYHQEAQIKRLQTEAQEQAAMIQRHMEQENARTQQRLVELTDLRHKVRELEQARGPVV